MADQSQTVTAGIIACVVGVTIQFAAEKAKGFISFELHAFIIGYLIMAIGCIMTWVGMMTHSPDKNSESSSED